MTTLSVSDAVEWVAAVFVRNGCSADNAQSVARALVSAEADGLKGHGLSRIPTYLQMVRSGKVDGIARPSSTRPRPGVLAIDAAKRLRDRFMQLLRIPQITPHLRTFQI